MFVVDCIKNIRKVRKKTLKLTFLKKDLENINIKLELVGLAVKEQTEAGMLKPIISIRIWDI